MRFTKPTCDSKFFSDRMRWKMAEDGKLNGSDRRQQSENESCLRVPADSGFRFFVSLREIRLPLVLEILGNKARSVLQE